MSTPSRAAGMPAPRPQVGRLATAAMLLSASFVLSRVLGVLRMSVIAAVFGNSQAVAAYFAAFRLPDTMFMLVSGGALASAFVPLFAGLVEQRSDEEAWQTASTVLTTVLLAMAGLAAIFFVFAPQIMGVLVGSGGGGFTPAQRSLTVDLTRIMLLQPIFLGASAIVTSILQTYHRFVLTAIAPLIYNVAVIVGALLGRTFGVSSLAWAVVLGAAGQLLIQLPGLLPEARNRLRASLEWSSSSTRKVLQLFGPRVVGLAAFQAMLFVTLFLAARIQEGRAVNAINYSWPIVQFPVGALGIAAGTAIFPTLARLSSSEDMLAMRRTVNRSLRLVLFLALPATVGLVILRRPAVNVLYAHGAAWNSAATEETAFALLFYALALAPLASIEILARVFYAMENTVTPVRIAVVAVAVDTVLSVVFVHLMPQSSGQGGLALATAVATTLQVAWLCLAANVALGGIGFASIKGTLRDSAAASIAMGLVLYVVLTGLEAVLPQQGVGVVVTLVIELAVGGAVFAWACYLLGAPELWEVAGLLQRQRS
jgi:putative peptidoglycan lipid II flippase